MVPELPEDRESVSASTDSHASKLPVRSSKRIQKKAFDQILCMQSEPIDDSSGVATIQLAVENDANGTSKSATSLKRRKTSSSTLVGGMDSRQASSLLDNSEETTAQTEQPVVKPPKPPYRGHHPKRGVGGKAKRNADGTGPIRRRYRQRHDPSGQQSSAGRVTRKYSSGNIIKHEGPVFHDWECGGETLRYSETFHCISLAHASRYSNALQIWINTFGGGSTQAFFASNNNNNAAINTTNGSWWSVAPSAASVVAVSEKAAQNTSTHRIGYALSPPPPSTSALAASVLLSSTNGVPNLALGSSESALVKPMLASINALSSVSSLDITASAVNSQLSDNAAADASPPPSSRRFFLQPVFVESQACFGYPPKCLVIDQDVLVPAATRASSSKGSGRSSRQNAAAAPTDDNDAVFACFLCQFRSPPFSISQAVDSYLKIISPVSHAVHENTPSSAAATSTQTTSEYDMDVEQNALNPIVALPQKPSSPGVGNLIYVALQHHIQDTVHCDDNFISKSFHQFLTHLDKQHGPFVQSLEFDLDFLQGDLYFRLNTIVEGDTDLTQNSSSSSTDAEISTPAENEIEKSSSSQQRSKNTTLSAKRSLSPTASSSRNQQAIKKASIAVDTEKISNMLAKMTSGRIRRIVQPVRIPPRTYIHSVTGRPINPIIEASLLLGNNTRGSGGTVDSDEEPLPAWQECMSMWQTNDYIDISRDEKWLIQSWKLHSHACGLNHRNTTISMYDAARLFLEHYLFDVAQQQSAASLLQNKIPWKSLPLMLSAFLLHGSISRNELDSLRTIYVSVRNKVLNTTKHHEQRNLMDSEDDIDADRPTARVTTGSKNDAVNRLNDKKHAQQRNAAVVAVNRPGILKKTASNQLQRTPSNTAMRQQQQHRLGKTDDDSVYLSANSQSSSAASSTDLSSSNFQPNSQSSFYSIASASSSMQDSSTAAKLKSVNVSGKSTLSASRK